MRKNTTEAWIVLDDPNGFRCRVCDLKYTVREDGTFEYAFIPDYGVIDMLPSDVFQGIPGLDLDLRRDIYVRSNIVPVFITERTPGPNREELTYLLEEAEMDHLNRLEWLIRTGSRYFGDNLYAVRGDGYDGKHTTSFDSEVDLRKGSACRQIMNEICKGNDVELPRMHIDDTNRKDAYRLLSFLVSNENASPKKESETRGRPKTGVCVIDLIEADEMMENGTISSQQAADRLGISRSTLFRRLRDMKDKNEDSRPRNE